MKRRGFSLSVIALEQMWGFIVVACFSGKKKEEEEEEERSSFCYVLEAESPSMVQLCLASDAQARSSSAWHLMKTHLKHHSMAGGHVVRQHGSSFSSSSFPTSSFSSSSTKATNAITKSSPSWPQQILTTSLEPALHKLTFSLMRQKCPF